MGAGAELAWPGCAVVVPAGGRARRMGGEDKLAADLGGRPLLDALLSGVPPQVPVCVVGPARDLSRPVLTAREDPPLGGPAAAVAAGLEALCAAGVLVDPGGSGGADVVVLLAGDAPWAPAAVPALLAALAEAGPSAGAAVGVDGRGRRQPLLAAHRAPALLSRVASGGGAAGLAGRPASWLLDGASAVEVRVADADAADVDTPGDLDAARRRLAPCRGRPPARG